VTVLQDVFPQLTRLDAFPQPSLIELPPDLSHAHLAPWQTVVHDERSWASSQSVILPKGMGRGSQRPGGTGLSTEDETMEQSRSPEILEQLLRYLDDEISRDDLQDWLVPLAWDDSSLDGEAQDLVRSIQLYLAEFTSGHLMEDELREQLSALMPRTVTRVLQYGQRMPFSTSGLQNIRASWSATTTGNASMFTGSRRSVAGTGSEVVRA